MKRRQSKAHQPRKLGNSRSREEKRRGNAETRLNELLADLKKAGLTPAELKSYKKQAQAAAAEPTKPAEAVTRQPEPAKALEEPKEPNPEEYTAAKYGDVEKAYAAYDKDLKQFYKNLAKFEADKGIRDYEAKQQDLARQRELDRAISEVKTRRPDVVEVIVPAAKALFQDAVPQTIRDMIASSDHYIDLVYVLGRRSGEVRCLHSTGKEQPGAGHP
jgi:hypothetical protein